MESITIRFRYTLNDLMRSYKAYRSRTLLYKVGLILGVIFLCIGFWYVVEFGFDWTSFLLIFLSILLIFDLVRILRIWLSFRRNEEIYTQEYEVSIDDTGLHVKGINVESHNKWERYVDVIENDKLFMLIYGKWLYSTIPKRAFSNQEQTTWFRDLLREKIGENSGKKTAL